MLARVRPPARLQGTLRLPGDKSISHRALLLNAIAAGDARLEGLSDGADVASTAACLRALGVEIVEGRVAGRGRFGLRAPPAPLDCGNSGTTMRLLAGLLAPMPFETVLIGDESLSRRPMERVAEPLRRMGARVETGPLRVGGEGALAGIDYVSPVASAQVKSAVLLAGLAAAGRTTFTEPARSRDHTERMLRAMGADVAVRGTAVSITGGGEDLRPLDATIPGDLSAAAFWLVAGALHPHAELRLPGAGVNPTRTAVLEALRAAGAIVVQARRRTAGAEPVADLEVGTATGLRALRLGAAESAALIDELPVLAVACTALPGRSVIAGAAELRVKESDRIETMAAGLRAMGARVEVRRDGWEIEGPCRLQGARLDPAGDHRVAMALAVAGLLAAGETEIEGAECVDISYPGFWRDLETLTT